MSRVEVTIDGARVDDATRGLERQDVAAVLGSQCLESGWSLSVNIGGLGAGSHSVSAVAVDPSGNAAEMGGSKSITVTAASAWGWTEYLYLGAQLLATIDGSTTKYHHSDHLSMRLTTDTNGSVTATSGHFPYGENWYETGGSNKLKFTSYERDAESGNDYAIFRSHISRLGRFSSPDAIAGSIGNPQSLNRYAYSLNDPINVTDPLGLSPESEDPESPNYLYLMEAGNALNTWGARGCVRCQFDSFMMRSVLSANARFVRGQMSNDAQRAGYAVFWDGVPWNDLARSIMPGSPFETEQAAAIAAFWLISIRSFADKYEYGVKIYRTTAGNYSFTEWARGDVPCDTNLSCGVNISQLTIPEGAWWVASFHTHPDESHYASGDSTELSMTDYNSNVFSWSIFSVYLGSIAGPRLIHFDIPRNPRAQFTPVVILGPPLPGGP